MKKSREEENEDEDYEYGNEDDDYKNGNEDNDETMSQEEKIKIIKDLNDNLDKTIDKSKSFEYLIESLKKVEDLKG